MKDIRTTLIDFCKHNGIQSIVPSKVNSIEELVDDFILHEMNTPKECKHDFSDGTGTGWYVCKKCGDIF